MKGFRELGGICAKGGRGGKLEAVKELGKVL